MRIEFPEDKVLFDGSGDPVRIMANRSMYAILTSEGFSSFDIPHTKKLYLPESALDNFIAIEDTADILHTKTDKFKMMYKFWYHPDLNCYIAIKTTNGQRYHYDDLEEDEVEKMVRVLSIYYKYENVQDVILFMNKHIIDNVSSENKIDIIVQTQMGFEFIEHSIKPTEVDIDTMYNDDFRPVYDHVVEKLNNAGKGIVLFHGTAGTGKTTLIRHLTTVVKEKFVFVPINMIAHISSPSFIGDLIDNKGGILVIEDCENFIQDRAESQNSIVSSLLQVTDGILSDILGLKVICTFNTDLTRVDPALLREGRLIAEYKFEELSEDKATELAGHSIEGPKTLSNIFNDLTYTQNKKVEKTIGFGQ